MDAEGEIVNKAVIDEAAASASQRLLHAVDGIRAGEWKLAYQLAFEYLFPAAAAVLVLVVSYFVAKYASRIASTPVRRRVDETLGRFIGKLVFNIMIVAAFVGVLGSFGVNVTSFAAILGAAGFAIGLAFQGTLSNFASGILLLVFRPFKVGDMVVVAGMTGKVNEIDLFTTTLDTPDNRRIIVPNSSIAGNTIENITHHPHRRIEIVVGVAYDCSLDETRAALSKAAESLSSQMVAGPDRGYQIILNHLGPHSVDWSVRFWGNTKDFAIVRESLLSEVKKQLDGAGLKIPFPQMDIHVIPSHNPSDGFQVEMGTDPLRQRPRMRTDRAA